jgi:hypothetical protein
VNSYGFFFLPRVFGFSEVAGPEKGKNLAGKSSPPDSDPLTILILKENDLGLSTQFAFAGQARIASLDLVRDVGVLRLLDKYL